MKCVLLAIQPKWCEKIFNGEKTIEVRKSRPKIETPFKSYIYCTKGKSRLISVQKDGDIDYYGEVYHGKTLFIKCPQIFWNKKCENISGKVIGEFICDKVDTYTFSNYEAQYRINDVDLIKTCLNFPELIAYGKGKILYGWHISDLKIYDKPKELGEFRKSCNHINDCCTCKEAEFQYDGDELRGLVCRREIPLIRPPQSWCYIEV